MATARNPSPVCGPDPDRPPSRAILCACALALVVVAALHACAASPPSDQALDRMPAVAGRFYPEDPDRLSAAVDGFLADAAPPLGVRPLALVAPHAGYMYCGAILADAYVQARGLSPDVVVVLGTNHTTLSFSGISVYPAGAFVTPLGRAEIDTALASALIASDDAFTFEREVHRTEHSVEVQIPFVQRLFPRARILPLVVGRADPDLCRRLGQTLGRLLAGREALIVASSDLSHYPDHAHALDVDLATLGAVVSLDADRVREAARDPENRDVPGLLTCACGEGPILAAIAAAKALGATGAALISYANSGDTVLGDRDRVVGYGAVVLTADEIPASAAPLVVGEPLPPSDGEPALTPADREGLLALARASIARYVTTDTAPLARGLGPATRLPRGAFVTLRKHGRLRGCIGHMSGDQPLDLTVGAMALQSAFADRRFEPVTADEVDALTIEISVLTPTTPVKSPDEIVPGRDGVIIRKDGKSAVYLPQVATEQGWGRDELLDQLCLKAGLPRGAWRDIDATLLVFQAIVFGEEAQAPESTPEPATSES